ncbi:type IX secretion system outer membrane channel protein PorV [Hymenobacter sp. BT770]|uniref:type IX secretion system outer membrane channel protein PorV n=1 Tax=Hymenobacter sp. BT770 TaxID=2886942 RepID=UPI001D1150CA|nr:type IX secretion system outer membrane channel protein PorV [Hymenobacter sp. BT770]MCC3151507.1 type IX secretion system outer membrane channel protein PorV [Hymenobacter sp. BT770]MDO3413917.1 type IX secretion system outer membrane channel protein PorV [Hymenobacter sp. BT770]
MYSSFSRSRVALFAGLLAIAATGQTKAQLSPHAITTAVPILTLSPDARASALGEAGVATSPDANSAYFNAGKLGFVPYKYSAAASYSPWLRNITDDMSLSYLSAYGKVGQRSAFGGSLMYFDLGTIDYRNGQNIPQGSFSPKEYALTVSYGIQLTDNFGVGASARYIRSNLVGTVNGNDAKPGNAAAVDLGAYYSKDATIGSGLYNLAFGASVTNIGNKITYNDAENPSFLPTTLKLGTALTREIDQYNKITLVFDASKLLVPSPYYDVNGVLLDNDPEIVAKNKEIANKSIVSGILGSFSDAPGGFKEELREINLSTGLEYNYNDLLYARGGYFYEAPDKGDRQYVSMGLGVRYQVFGIDGTYLVPTGGNSQNNPLAQTIRVSLHFNLNKLSQAFDENGAGGTSGEAPSN